MPAWQVQLTDGTWFNTCPNADYCAQLCYARSGTYLFSTVKAKHIANLEYTLNDLVGWKLDMIDEINRIGLHKIKWLRIHDAGDFYSEDYLRAWINICSTVPSVTFYAYTKQVSMFKKVLKDYCPSNFKYLFSLGGKEDHLISLENDRHAEVFPDHESLVEAGYSDQSENDLLAITLPSNRIGITANNIKHLQKKQARHTFGSGQAERTFKREDH